VRLATTAFSFTNEWLARQVTLEQLLVRVSELGLGPGVELIGFQTWRSYPDLAPEEIRAFRRLVERLGLEPASLGAYADLARRTDRLTTVEETVEYLRPQIAVAAALGFPLLRLHAGIPPAALERLTPDAERAGVTLAVEVQAGQVPESPNVALVLDFSVAMTGVPAAFVDAVCRLGAARADVDRLVELWADGADIRELFAAIAELDAPGAARDEARGGFVRFGRQDPEAWIPLVPRIAFAHAKFWELDEDGGDPSVREAELIRVLRDGGFDGFVCSEWGGNAWLDATDVDAFDLVRRHHAHIDDLILSQPVGVPVRR
jgi:hypothetical protein